LCGAFPNPFQTLHSRKEMFRFVSCAAFGVVTEAWNQSTETECAESLFHAGWDCFDDVLWAKHTGIHQNPEWYESLTASSSIEEFHGYISALPLCSPEQPAPCAAHSCTRPCYQNDPQESKFCRIGVSTPDGTYQQWQNVCTPDGNGGSNMIGGSGTTWDGCSSTGSISRLHFSNSWNCSSGADYSWNTWAHHVNDPDYGCCNQDTSRCSLLGCYAYAEASTCHRVSPESECAGQMRWAMTQGVHEHPEWYPGLSVDSSLDAFQLYLAGLPRCSENGFLPPCYAGANQCPTPCSAKNNGIVDVVV